jgi:biotin carboxyl carrier protein
MPGFVSVLSAPMPGKIISILVREGEDVNSGQEVLALDSVKTGVPVKAPVAGTVKKVRVKLGDNVTKGEVLVEFI